MKSLSLAIDELIEIQKQSRHGNERGSFGGLCA
jgi:hypothetical protein